MCWVRGTGVALPECHRVCRLLTDLDFKLHKVVIRCLTTCSIALCVYVGVAVNICV